MPSYVTGISRTQENLARLSLSERMSAYVCVCVCVVCVEKLEIESYEEIADSVRVSK